jgi:hypothetical protein
MLSHGGDLYFGKVWVVSEVLQSGRDTYTVFLTSRSEYLDHLRRKSDKTDLSFELLEFARQTAASVSERRRRWKYRDYEP